MTVTGMDGLGLLVRRATATEVEAAGVAVIGDSRPAATPEASPSSQIPREERCWNC